jgi:hypothetical protein
MTASGRKAGVHTRLADTLIILVGLFRFSSAAPDFDISLETIAPNQLTQRQDLKTPKIYADAISQ